MRLSIYFVGMVLITVTALSLLLGCGKPQEMSLAELEQRRDGLEEELRQLANLSLRGEVGSNGYRSPPTLEGDLTEWVEVDLGGDVSVDEIILAPALVRTAGGIQSEGFPLEFRILAGSAGEEGKIIAEFTEEDQLLPRIAPLLVPCPGTEASWVRIEATRLSPRSFDGYFALQLSELMVFGGGKNRALRRPVSGPRAEDPRLIDTWSLKFLTDGAVPYLMDAATGEKSLAYLSEVGVVDRPSLTVDLEESRTISTVILHPVDQSDTIPQTLPGDAGVPRHFILEGALQPDFSDAVQLLECRIRTLYDISPVMNWNIAPAKPCRYVRLTALEPYLADTGLVSGPRIGFAEIELMSGGRNAALSKSVTSNFPKVKGISHLSVMTDGRNYYGDIIPIRSWMHQLARRHDLERERPVIAAELQRRYARQEAILNRMSWLAGLLAGGILLIVLVSRMLRNRQLAELRARFAADLHDELGADLHTIGLLSDLASQAYGDPVKLDKLLQQIRTTTEETGAAVRHCADMQGADLPGNRLSADLHRVAERIVVNLEHRFSSEGEGFLERLTPRARTDIFLFYKECLVNIARHSGATRLRTHLAATSRKVRLTIEDNGVGLERLPPSLERRASLIRAHVRVDESGNNGTKIVLTLRTRRL